MANSKRKCGYCGERKPAETMHIVGCQAFCNVDHWIENQVKNKDKLVKQGQKIQRAETKKKKESIKTRAQWLKDAQCWFNRYIRLRDKGDPCISCGRHHQGQYHAGHYLSVGANPELRFIEINNHKQCAPCNNHLSGNIANYRPSLIRKIGLEKVEWLEGPHEPAKHTIDDCKKIIKTYKQKCKEID